MALKVDNKTVSKTAWGDVDKSALGKRLADAYAAGEATKAQIREVYAFVPEDAFGTDGEGKKTFAYTKGWGPHHEVKGTSIVLNRGGVAGSAGALAGSRSEPSLSATELAAAKRHMRRHYKSHLKEDVPEGIAESLRKAAKGKPLEELVKGSLDYTLDQIWRAFRAQFKDESEWDYSFWIVETFADHVIVNGMELAPDEYYYVTYEKTADGYVFAERDAWEVVELAYQPKTLNERTLTPKAGARPAPTREGEEEGKRFVERIASGVMRLEEAVAGQPRYINGSGITADVVNANGRRYPTPVIIEAVLELQNHLHESAGQGRLVVLGEAEHPADKSGRPQFLETIVNWAGGHVRFDEATRIVDLRGQILETTKGRDAIAIMEGGVMPGISMRGYGQSKFIKENGTTVEEVTKLTITGFDLVSPGEASDPNGGVHVLESRQERKTMDPQELIQLLTASGFIDTLTEKLRGQLQEAMAADDKGRKEKALREALGIGEKDNLVEAALTKLAERPLESKALDAAMRQMLGISDTEDLQEAVQARARRMVELEEAETKRQVGEYIAKEIGATKYPEWMKKQMAEAVTALAPKSIEEAKTLITSRRKEYDGIMAQIELTAMGHPDALRVLGPVLERDTGVPEFARVSFELSESLVRHGQAPRRDFRKPATVNEQFTALVLERYDERNRHHLVREAQLFQEAETASDLSLPYSVSRAIIAEAFPRLVAASLFDTALMDGSPTYLFYEAYAGESGYTASVADEDVTADDDTWVDLDYKRVTPGTVVVDPAAGGAAYSEGDDYVIDYAGGRIKTLSVGTIADGAALHVDYSYTAIRKGEMVAIERGEVNLSQKTITAAADRLATQVSREAVVFGRSQLGYDATTRTIAQLIKQVNRKIDQGIFYMGLAAALSVASNSGGTWDHAADTIEHLVEFAGVAKVKVANRFYEPTGYLMSVTNSDRLGNWEGFSAAGERPDGVLRAEGYVGRLKGLPCYESPVFPDDYILVANRELVAYRILQPMQLFGPYPTYDVSGGTSKLLAADQYYVEEFNATEAPVAEKGAVVRII